MLQQQGVASPAGNSPASTAPKETQRREAGGRLIRSILINNEARQSQSSTAVQPQQKIQILNSESGKRPPRNVNARLGLNGLVSKNEQETGIDLIVVFGLLFVDLMFHMLVMRTCHPLCCILLNHNVIHLKVLLRMDFGVL